MTLNISSLSHNAAAFNFEPLPIIWEEDLPDFGAAGELDALNSGGAVRGSISYMGPSVFESDSSLEEPTLDSMINALRAHLLRDKLEQEVAAYEARLAMARGFLLKGIRGGILGAIVILALLIPFIIETVKAAEDHEGYKTFVTVEIGNTGKDKVHNADVLNINQGGSVPHLTIWDENGHRIGRYDGDANGHLNIGDIGHYEIKHDGNGNAYATYLAIDMQESDAICISHISLQQPNGVYFDWLGDIGYACGAEWYYNAGPTNVWGYTPRCTFLDQDHSAGIKYSGMGMHLPDFIASGQRLSQYTLNPETLCSSPPRFQMYEKFDWDSSHVFFQPPLEYTGSGADKDPKRVIRNKGVTDGGKHPAYEFMQAIPHWRDTLSTMFNQAPEEGSSHVPKVEKVEVPRSIGTGKYHPRHKNHLVSSDYKYHSAKELCNSETSLGPDFVNLREGIFCDMGAKQIWPICNDDSGITHACFNYTNRTMHKAAIGPSRVFLASEFNSPPHKVYESENVWRMGAEAKYLAHM